MGTPLRIEPNRKIEAQINSVLTLKNYAYAMIVGIASISIALNRDAFLSIWTVPKTSAELPLFVCHLLLFLVLLGLTLGFIGTTAHELNLWIEWLYVPFVRYQVFIAMFGLAIGLGLMFLLLYNIVIFTLYYSCFLLINLWTNWLSNDHFRRSLALTEAKDPSAKNERALQAMKYYWLERPQLARVGVMLVISLGAFVIALIGRQSTDASRKGLLEIAAYVVLILDISIGEVVMFR